MDSGEFPLSPEPSTACLFFARTDEPTPYTVSVSLEGAEELRTFAKASVDLLGSTWRRYTIVLDTAPDFRATSKAQLVLSSSRTGNLWIDLVSVFPSTWGDDDNGVRIDLMDKILGLHPAFVRFTGGDYLMGANLRSRFEWKDAIGPLSARPTHQTPWGNQGPSGYWSSDGMGCLSFSVGARPYMQNPYWASTPAYRIGTQPCGLGRTSIRMYKMRSTKSNTLLSIDRRPGGAASCRRTSRPIFARIRRDRQ